MIVVIDDEIEFLNALVSLIELEGYEVQAFQNFDRARSYIQEHLETVQLVLCDYHIRDEEGLAFLEQLPQRIYYCLMSGDEFIEEDKIPMIQKPFDFDVFFKMLKEKIQSS